MNKLWSYVRNTFLEKHFIIFVIIGLVNTFNGTLFASIFSCFLQPNIAFIVGYIISLIIAYILNSIVNFKQKLSFVKLIKFAISYIPNFIIQNGIVILFYNILAWNKVLTYALAAVIGIPVTYLALKYFTFKSDKSK